MPTHQDLVAIMLPAADQMCDFGRNIRGEDTAMSDDPAFHLFQGSLLAIVACDSNDITAQEILLRHDTLQAQH